MKLLLCLLLLLILSLVHQSVYAQSTTPSVFYCVGSNPQPPCATIPPTQFFLLTATPTIFIQSSNTNTSVHTSLSPQQTVSPSIAPCKNKGHDNDKNKDKDKNKGKDSDKNKNKQDASVIQGLLQQLLQFFSQLQLFFSQQFGGVVSNPCPTPSTSPSPSSGVSPSSSVSPSTSPSPSISPSTSPSPSVSPSTSPSPSVSPSTSPSPSISPSTSPSPSVSPKPIACFDNKGNMNWSGYVASPPKNAQQVYVSSNWKVSALNCQKNTYGISEWVGISSVHQWISQLGSYDRCINGTGVYFGFTEAFPAPVIAIKYPVKAGDTIIANTEMTSQYNFLTTIMDTTQGWSYSTPMQFGQNSQSLANAEVILENEGFSTKQPLPQFTTAAFTKNIVSINNNKAATPLANAPGLTCLNAAQNGFLQDSTSPLNGSDFSITWKHN